MFCTVPSVGVCVCVCVHVSSFAFLISQCLILLMFKDPLTTKSRFLAVVVFISDANNLNQWLGLQCLPRGSVQSALAVSHVSLSCTVSCWLQPRSQPVLCCAEVRRWGKLAVSASSETLKMTGGASQNLLTWGERKAPWSEEERQKEEGKENKVDEDIDKEGTMFFFCSLLRHRVQPVTWHARETVLRCCSINLLVLLQRQEENSGMNTHRFVIAHFVQLLLCHGHWRNYTQQADVAASTHADTEMGPMLCFPLKNNCDRRTAGMAWGKKGILSVSCLFFVSCVFLPISCYICLSCTWGNLSLCSFSTMTFWTQYIPCHLIPFQSLYWRLSLSLPLTVAIWAFDPVEILWQACLRGQRKRDDIVLQQIHRSDVRGALPEVWGSLS